jgi:ribosomal protein S8
MMNYKINLMKNEKRINKEYDEIYSNYIESLVNWLDDNGYIKDV